MSFIEWCGQAGPTHHHVHPVLSRLQCVRWRLWCWRGVWHGQQRWKRQHLWLFGPNTAQLVSHNNIWQWALVTASRSESMWAVIMSSVAWLEWEFKVHSWVFFFFFNWHHQSQLLFTSNITLAAGLAQHLHLLSPGRSNLRIMVRGRMLISLPAALVLKMTPEQMASQT